MAEKMTLLDVRDWHRFSQQAAEADGHNKMAEAHKELADAIDAHLAQSAQAVDVGALIYAEHLARALWQKHYAKDAPQWEPMTGNLFGLLSQIDNMASGLTRAISNVQGFN